MKISHDKHGKKHILRIYIYIYIRLKSKHLKNIYDDCFFLDDAVYNVASRHRSAPARFPLTSSACTLA